MGGILLAGCNLGPPTDPGTKVVEFEIGRKQSVESALVRLGAEDGKEALGAATCFVCAGPCLYPVTAIGSVGRERAYMDKPVECARD